MKLVSLTLIGAAAMFVAPAFAQMGNLNQTGGAAHSAVCRTGDLKACKDTCKKDRDDNIKLICSKDPAKEADCKKTQSKLMSTCNDGCQKQWCS